jgi:aspartyl-tRNA(Asn)/glutamyl-tRNA(Gln) amidotransferase subunit C
VPPATASLAVAPAWCPGTGHGLTIPTSGHRQRATFGGDPGGAGALRRPVGARSGGLYDAGMAQRITRDDVAHVADLARLALTDEELELFTVQLGAVLEHADDVESLDTEGVPPTAHPLPLVNVLRDDVVRPSLDRDEVLAAAPSVEDHRFRVPPALGEEQ